MKKLLASTALAVTLLISGCAGADDLIVKQFRILYRKCRLLKIKRSSHRLQRKESS